MGWRELCSTLIAKGTRDNCTLFPEGEWTSCCKTHDDAYSTGVSRSEADQALRECVRKAGFPKIAWIMWVGVRVFGYPRWWWGHRKALRKLRK